MKLDKRINVRPESVRWITKYSKSLQNQTLILGSYFSEEINFASFGITRLHELVVFGHNYLPELRCEPRKLRLAFCKLEELKQSTILLPSIDIFEAQMVITTTQTNNLLKSLPPSLTSLELSWISLACSDCPRFPNVVELRLMYPNDNCRRSLEKIQEKFPMLRKLYFQEYGCDQPVSLEPLESSELQLLVIASNNLTDLTPLAEIATLRELDVRGCPKIVDFSLVRHVPIVRTNH
jgi:hypothetical protein